METSSWKGWAELENDPSIFSTLLREWGVLGVQVNEVVPLDSIFDIPAESVYGLIFLARWTAVETQNDTTEAPPGVWFANQTSSFSCASVAIMNIINNHFELDLGQALNRFRYETINMTPKDRGIALDQLDHVRDVHNSFATNLDRMNVDLRLKDDVVEAERKKKQAEQAKNRKTTKRRKRNSFHRDDEENGFHFIAYVPAGGSVWRMDGMEAFPRLIDTISEGDNWLLKILTDLQGQWESAESNKLEFSLLSLVPRVDAHGADEDEKMLRMRENWGPFIAHMVKLHSDKGDLKSKIV